MYSPPLCFFLSAHFAIPYYKCTSFSSGFRQSFPTAVPLWMAVADRAPQAFCASAAWQQLPIGMVQQQQQSIMGNSSTGSGASSSKDVSSSELALLVAAATAVDRHSSGIPNVQTAIYALGDGYFVPMVPQFLQLIRQTIQDAANNNNDDDDSSMLTLWELLIEATEDVPNLLCGTENCLSAILEICHVQLSSTACNNSNTNSNGNLLSAVRLVALVCQIPSVKVVAAAASRSTAGLSLQQKVDQLHKLAVIACWNTMIQEPQGDEDYLLNLQGWAFEPVSLYDDDENSDDEDDAEFYHAQALLSELLRSSAPQKTLEVLLPTVEQAFAAVTPPASQQQCLYTRSSERLHCAALCALQCCLESIPVAFAAHRPVTLQAAVHAASVQSNARVQFHALRLLGVLGETCVVPDTDIAPTSSGDVACLPDSSRMILQQLTQATNHGCTKIAAMACQALVSFCRPIVKAESASTESERSSASALAPFLSDVLQALVRGPLSLDLNRLGSAVVQVRATGVVACFAQLAGASSFAPYYSSVMPSLLSRTNMATGGKDENLQLAGASLEAATMIGQAVGIDLFRTDAHQIMQWIVSTQMLQQSQEPSIPMDLVLSACARIASVLGPDYVPYMDAVLPKLLHFATDPSDVEFSVSKSSSCCRYILVRNISQFCVLLACLCTTGRRVKCLVWMNQSDNEVNGTKLGMKA